MLNLHLASIGITFILFLITYFSYKSNPTDEPMVDNRRAFILHMTLRLFYIIVIFTGIMIFVQNLSIIGNIDNGHMTYGIKALIGILSIGLMEMALVREKRGKKSQTMLIIALVVTIATIALGSYLPMGVLAF